MPLNHACQPETELETNPPSIARGVRGVETFRRGGAFLEFEFLIRFLSLSAKPVLEWSVSKEERFCYNWRMKMGIDFHIRVE